jgi:hypothetical protein
MKELEQHDIGAHKEHVLANGTNALSFFALP